MRLTNDTYLILIGSAKSGRTDRTGSREGVPDEPPF
jgi:hypothetical protein